MPCIYQHKLLAFALGLAFAGWSTATTLPPRIEPSEVNTRNIGSCETYDPNDPYNLNNGAGAISLSPVGVVVMYVHSYQKAYLTDFNPEDYSVR